ncbi:MAG: RNA polymerase sigma factor [Aggregatilineales bacterium]
MREHNQINSQDEASGGYDGYDPDWQLIREMADGNIAALDTLYANYGSLLLNFLRARVNNQQLAEEVLQDVMLAAWNSASKFQEQSKVKTWLLVIARNRAINATRKKQLPVVPVDDVFNLQTDETGPMEKAIRHDRQAVVRDAIQQLPDAQREVLVLVFYHQLTGAEVAEVMDISEGTVKSRLHRAKKALKGILGSEDFL